MKKLFKTNLGLKVVLIYTIVFAYFSSVWGHSLFTEIFLFFIFSVVGIFLIIYSINGLFCQKNIVSILPIIIFIIMSLVPYDYLSAYIKLRLNFYNYEKVTALALNNKLEIAEHHKFTDYETKSLIIPNEYKNLTIYDLDILIRRRDNYSPTLYFVQFSVFVDKSKGYVYDPNPTQETLEEYLHLYKNWYWKYNWHTRFDSLP